MNDTDPISAAVDNLADQVEDGIEGAMSTLGLDAEELIDRLANELKARNLGQ